MKDTSKAEGVASDVPTSSDSKESCNAQNENKLSKNEPPEIVNALASHFQRFHPEIKIIEVEEDDIECLQNIKDAWLM